MIPDSPALRPHASCMEAKEWAKEEKREWSTSLSESAPEVGKFSKLNRKNFSTAGWLTGLDVWRAERRVDTDRLKKNGTKKKRTYGWNDEGQGSRGSGLGAIIYLLTFPLVKPWWDHPFHLSTTPGRNMCSQPTPPKLEPRGTCVWWDSSAGGSFQWKGAELNFHWGTTTMRNTFHCHQQWTDTANAVNSLQNSQRQTGRLVCKHTNTHASKQQIGMEGCAAYAHKITRVCAQCVHCKYKQGLSMALSQNYIFIV